jgi:hypothetical protein
MSGLKNANRWYINMVGDMYTLSESDKEYEDEDLPSRAKVCALHGSGACHMSPSP